jgi:uncharacterized protein (TIGR03437 family)
MGPTLFFLSAVVAFSQVTQNSAQTVSAASYSVSAGIAPNSIASTFGSDLATATEAARSQPLPTGLAGTTVSITDSTGATQLCPLFFVSPGQVNHFIPVGVALGNATVKVTSGDGTVTTISGVQIVAASIGIFSANSSGNGPPSAYAQRFRADGSVVNTLLAVYDPILKRFVSQPIDLGAAGDQTYITLFGTGLRALPAQSFQALLNGFHMFPVSYVGAQGQFVGLDQVNIGPILPSDAIDAFENGFGDITMSLLSLSGSQSNELLFRIIHPDFVPFAQLLSTDTGIRGQTIQQFKVWGDYLAPAGKVSINPPDGLTMTNISIFDTRITFDLTIDASAATGARQLLLTTPYGTSTPTLTFSVQDPASPNPVLTNLVVDGNTISFSFASPGAHLTAGSLLNISGSEVNFATDLSQDCQSSYQSNALAHSGQTTGQVQYTFSPPLANVFFSRHYTDLGISVTDATGARSNTVGTRVDDPVFGCFQLPRNQ